MTPCTGIVMAIVAKGLEVRKQKASRDETKEWKSEAKAEKLIKPLEGGLVVKKGKNTRASRACARLTP